MHFEYTVDISAPPDRVWQIMSDIESWPEWTGTTKSATLHGPLERGAKATLEVDGTPKSSFVVTAIEPGRSFVWETTARGVRAAAGHYIEERPHGSHVRLTLDFSGIASVLFRPMITRVTRRNIAKEAEGLKRAAEGAG